MPPSGNRGNLGRGQRPFYAAQQSSAVYMEQQKLKELAAERSVAESQFQKKGNQA